MRHSEKCVRVCAHPEAMEVHTLEALSDNYMYLIVDASSRAGAIVDPADPDVVVHAAQRLNVTLTHVLTTHHHFDHAGGNDKMKALVPGIAVVGGASDNVQGMTQAANDGDTFNVGGLTVRCLHTPSHTAGHMSYVLSADDGAPSAVFTGDILFVAGCGRMFEGGPDELHASMAKLATLPGETQVYAGHEYTVKNLQFAIDVEPDNPDVQRKIVWAQEARGRSEFTVPSTIAAELTFNPFMRTAQPAVVRYCGSPGDAVSVMRVLRNKKDKFAGSSRPWIPGGGPLPGL